MINKSIPENICGHFCTYMMWHKYTSKTHVVKQEKRKFLLVTSFTRCRASTCRSWKSEVRSLMAWLARITDKTPNPWWLLKQQNKKKLIIFQARHFFLNLITYARGYHEDIYNSPIRNIGLSCDQLKALDCWHFRDIIPVNTVHTFIYINANTCITNKDKMTKETLFHVISVEVTLCQDQV